jgi:hypothetical protein
MTTLPEVEHAKALMTEAMTWSVMKWLRERKRVRKVADQANAALDDLDRTVKGRWSHEQKTAYAELQEKKSATTDRRRSPGKQPSGAISPEVQQFARHVKEADDQAQDARMDAERSFDEAERQLSTSLAREGCQKAIRSWELREKAIRLSAA